MALGGSAGKVCSPASYGKAQVLAVDGALLGTLQNSMNPARKGLLRVNVGQDTSTIDIIYLGPQDLTGV